MLRTCAAAAAADGRICVFLEPIALYHARDLHDRGDGGWLAPYAPPSSWAAGHVPLGSGRTYGDGADLTLVTFGNGLRLSLRAARRLAAAGTAPVWIVGAGEAGRLCGAASGRQADRPRWDSASMVTAASRTSAVTM